MSRSEREYSPVQVEVVRDAADFYELEGIYRQHYRTSGMQNIFLSWEWLSSWMDVYGKEVTPCVFLVYFENVLVGIAPFYTLNPGGQNGNRQPLRFIGDQFVSSEYLSFIAGERDQLFVLAGILKYLLKSDCNFAGIFLDDIPGESRVLAALPVLAKKYGVFFVSRRKSVCPLLELNVPESLPESVRKHYEHAHSKLRRLYRRFVDRLEIRENDPDIERQVEELFELHQKLWQSRGEPGSFADPRKREFYRLVARRFLKQGKLNLFTMRIDDRPVASLIGFVAGRRFYYLQSGFDPEWKKYSVGTTLFYRILQTLRSRGITSVDFLRGDEKYKFLWGAKPRYTYTVHIYPHRLELMPPFLTRWLKWKLRSVVELLV